MVQMNGVTSKTKSLFANVQGRKMVSDEQSLLIVLFTVCLL